MLTSFHFLPFFKTFFFCVFKERRILYYLSYYDKKKQENHYCVELHGLYIYDIIEKEYVEFKSVSPPR